VLSRFGIPRSCAASPEQVTWSRSTTRGSRLETGWMLPISYLHVDAFVVALLYWQAERAVSLLCS
jgi:hypothetical protein